MHLAQQMVTQMEDLFDEAARDLNVLAEHLKVKGGCNKEDRADMEVVFNEMKKKTTSLRKLDKKGVLTCIISDGKQKEFAGRDYSRESYFIQPQKTGKSFISNVILENGQKRIFISVPVYAKMGSSNSAFSRPAGKFDGVLAFTIDLNFITSFLMPHLKPVRVKNFWILDDEGTLLVQPRHPEMELRNIFKNKGGCQSCHTSFEIQKRMVKGETGTGESEVKSSQRNLIAFAPLNIGNRHWSVAVTTPSFEVLALAKHNLRDTLILTLILCSWFLMGAVFLFQANRKKIRAEEKIKEEQKYRNLVEHAHDAICIIQDNHFKFANQRFLELSGYTWEELSHLDFTEVIAPEHREMVADRYHKRQKGENVPPNYEFIFLTKNAGRKDVELSVSLVEYQGRVASYCFLRDITERKKAEEALRESQAKLQSIFSAAPAGIGMTINQTIGKLNTRLCEITGYSKEELSGKSISVVYPSDQDYLSARSKIYNQLREKGHSTIEASWKRKDDKLISVLLNCALLKPGDFSQGITFTVLDITERKKAEETIRTERDKLESVTKNIGVGLAIISKDYRTLWANDVLKQIFGEVKGKLCYNTYNGRTDICPGCGVREVFESGKEMVVHEQAGKDRQGETIWSQIIATPVKDKDGNISGAMEVVVPITERKKAEEEIKDLAKFPSENPDPIMRISKDGIILYANDSSLSLLNEWRTSVNQPAPDYLRQLMTEVTNTGLRRNIEIEHKGRILSFIVVPICDVDYVNLYGRDITEQKQAEEKIKKSAKEWETTFNSIKDLVSVHDENLRFLRANKACAEFFKTKPEELVGKTCYEVLNGTEKPCSDCLYKQVLTTKKPAKREFFEPRLGLYLEASAHPVFNQQGEISGCVHIVKDISERKKAEEALQEERNKLQAIIDSMEYGLTIQDRDYNIIFQNEALKNLFGNGLGEKCYQAYEFRDKICDGCPVRMASPILPRGR